MQAETILKDRPETAALTEMEKEKCETKIDGKTKSKVNLVLANHVKQTESAIQEILFFFHFSPYFFVKLYVKILIILESTHQANCFYIWHDLNLNKFCFFSPRGDQ